MSHPTRPTPEPRYGGSDLPQVLASLEHLGLIRSQPLPQRSPGRYVSGFGSAPTVYIGASSTEVARVAAAVREWASQLSRCRDESAPGTGDLTDDESFESLSRGADSASLPPWLAVASIALQQDSMMGRMYRLARHLAPAHTRSEP